MYVSVCLSLILHGAINGKLMERDYRIPLGHYSRIHVENRDQSSNEQETSRPGPMPF